MGEVIQLSERGSRSQDSRPPKSARGLVIDWPEEWGELGSIECDWGGCDKAGIFARYDEFCGWLPVCYNCARKPVELS